MKSRLFIALSLFAFYAQAQKAAHLCSAGKINTLQQQKNKMASMSQTELMEQYDVKFHHINLNIERDTTYVSGNVRTVAQVVANKLDTFGFELHQQHAVDSVLDKNGNKLTVVRNQHFAYVVLPNPITKNNLVDVTIYYKGNASVTAGAAIGAGFSTGRSRTWGNQATWSLSQPYSAYEWWPCKQSLQDKIDSLFTFITTSAENKAGSQGLLQAVVSVDNGKVRYEWKSFYPVDYYLVSVAVAKYVEYKNYAHFGNDSMLIQHYVYDNPQTLITFKSLFDETADMLEAFSEHFGLYPFHQEKYGHAMAPFSGGMEHQTMTSIGVVNFDIVAHEVAHQWFGDYVTCRTWKDIWFNEGFASYCEYLAKEWLRPNETVLHMADVHSSIMRNAGGSIAFEDTSDVARMFSGRLTYDKGGAFIHILRYHVNNDSLFFAFLRDFLQTHAFGNASVDEFKNALELFTSKDFTAVFNQWYYGEGYPIYTIRWNQLNDTVYVQSTQTNSLNNANLFTDPLQLRLAYAGGGDTLITLQHTSNKAQAIFYRPSKTVNGVTIDPNNWLINGGNSAKDPNFTALKELLTLDQLVQVYPNPFYHTVNIQLPQSQKLTLELFDINGKLMMQDEVNHQQLTQINLEQPGIYFLRISNDQTSVVRKLIHLQN
ncbi:MAG: M1 family aminopeptidase [Bacteroidota bacterium]